MQTSLVTINNIQDAFLVALSNVLSNLVSFIPTIIAAVLIILAGVLVGKWLRWFTVKLLETVRLSAAIKDTAVEKFLQKAEITATIEHVIGNIVRWLVILVFFIAATNLLGLSPVSDFLTSILRYIPNVISAALILTVGVIVAGLVESLVKGSLAQINASTGRLVSKIASYMIMVFTILAAFAELNIASDLINTLFIGFVAMLAIGLGLAFGLGAKDLVAKILDVWYQDLKKDLK